MLMDLAGKWEVWLEHTEEEIPEKERPKKKPDGSVILPGIVQAQGYGNPITVDTPWVSGLHDPFWYEREEYSYGQDGGVSIPFLSQPPRHYTGRAWYEREFTVTEDTGDEFYLFVELTRWRSFAWVDKTPRGGDCSLCTAHQISLGKLSAGTHTLTVCIDNRFQYPYRPDGHEVSDALGATWNGMAGEIAVISAGEAKRRLEEKKRYAKELPRFLEVREGLFYVDGRPEYFRGTHFGGDYPLTGYPETNPDWWEKRMETIKEWGFNFLRCHSYCPPEAAFAAADRAGVYIQAECGMWNVFEEGIPMLSVLKDETRRILSQFGHHPSFVLLSASNEPSGKWYGPLKRWVKETREYDRSLGYEGRRLYTAQSGWFYDTPPEEITGTDYIYFHRSAYGPILGGNIRGFEGWRGKDYRASLKGARLPVICHEMGQWCSYPDFSVMEKFTGYLKPGNYSIFRESARAHGVLQKCREFAWCSGKNQVLMYKEDMEANFRTPHLYGFEMLDLHDYLGQGTALVGVLDPFWESKGYIKPEEFREFCGETVLLARMPSYVYQTEDQVLIPVEVCHFGKEPIKSCDVKWSIETEENGLKTVIFKGVWKDCCIPAAKNTQIGEIQPDFTVIKENIKLTLTVEMEKVRNHWDFFVYKKSSDCFDMENTSEVVYTREWQEAKRELERGKRVVYSPYLSELDFDCPPLSMRPVFWNSQMGPGWTRSLGLVIQSDHPLFRNFPTEEYGGWQWEEILDQARGFLLDEMPKGLTPIVSVVDDWNRNLPLGLIFEGRVSAGRLLFISACLEGEFWKRPAAWSLKKALLTYASSELFCPETELRPERIENHLFPNNRMRLLNASYRAEPDAAVINFTALEDENPNHSVWIEKDSYPISVEISFRERILVSGLIVVPDQKDRMHQGCVKDYVVHVRQGEIWKEAAKGYFASSFLSQKAWFDKEYDTEAIKFTALSGYAMGERPVWEERSDGWHCIKKQGIPAIQTAGLHIICDKKVQGSDTLFWKQFRKSKTKEIDN